MTDDPKDETPMERALRLRKAALDSKPKPPGGKLGPKQSQGMASGASKPWMKR